MKKHAKTGNLLCICRDIWTRTVAEDALGRRMAVLGVSEARKPDAGRWSCAAEDAGRRRCRALRLSVLRPPDIRLIPSTLTVNKVISNYYLTFFKDST